MGLWWKSVRATPQNENAVTFEGDPDALSKRYPILWRFAQNWHILEVENYREPFELYFSSNGHTMRCRRLIRTNYVAVRVGPEPVTFWARNSTLALVPRLKRTRFIIPASLRADNRDEYDKGICKASAPNTQFV